jgi:hypothetical protein
MQKRPVLQPFGVPERLRLFLRPGQETAKYSTATDEP